MLFLVIAHFRSRLLAQATALCWRPDGKVLAVGYRGAFTWLLVSLFLQVLSLLDGCVSLHDVESGEVRTTIAASLQRNTYKVCDSLRLGSVRGTALPSAPSPGSMKAPPQTRHGLPPRASRFLAHSSSSLIPLGFAACLTKHCQGDESPCAALPLCGSHCAPSDSAALEAKLADVDDFFHSRRLHILSSGDADGGCELSAFGAYPVRFCHLTRLTRHT